MVVNLRYEIVRGGGDPAAEFSARLVNRVGPKFDNIHEQVARQLTATSKELIEEQISRPQERGQRKRFRRTGALTGHSGRSSAIKATTTKSSRGKGQLQGRGVSFPDIDVLNRRAAHWRMLEEGADSLRMPSGAFLDSSGNPLPLGGAPGVFHTYKEVLRRSGLKSGRFGLSQRSREARQRRVGPRDLGGRDSLSVLRRAGEARGFAGRFYLRGSWDRVVGVDGRNIALKYEKAIRDEVGDFRLR